MEEKQALLLESLKKQREEFVQQRDQAHINFQQLTGAIHMCDIAIKQCEQNNG